ncbi:hypothetical protein LSAT2_002401 [Lamellibrachia satsuma]|nr:hypothetical protein LSAT2_002401 [Lamellibrachia satsuma]
MYHTVPVIPGAMQEVGGLAHSGFTCKQTCDNSTGKHELFTVTSYVTSYVISYVVNMKEATVEFPSKESGPNRWFNISLGVYGFVVSLLLAATIAGGAVYLNNLKQDLNVCKETHNNADTKALTTFTNEYNVVYRDNPNDPQKIQLNTLSKTEIFIQNGTVAVFDFLKNIGGFYFAEYNRCFLMGGIDERFKSPDDLKKQLDLMTGNQDVDSPTEDITYKWSRMAVTDQNFLPEALAPFCKGRPTYWLTPKTDDQAKRMRRGSVDVNLKFCGIEANDFAKRRHRTGNLPSPPGSSDYISTPWHIYPRHQSLLTTPVPLADLPLPPGSSDYISTPWQIYPCHQGLLTTSVPLADLPLPPGSSDYISTPWQIYPCHQGLLTTSVPPGISTLAIRGF